MNRPYYEKKNMNALFQISLNTFRETIRNKILYAIFFFALLIILLSVFFGQWSVFARIQVMQDFGLAAMSLAGLMLSIFIGVGMLGREIADKTLYNLLSRPISRSVFIWGKFFGLLAALILNFILMALFFIVVLSIMEAPPAPILLKALALTGVEMAVMIAAALFFSTLTTPMLASFFTLGFFIAGHSNDLLESIMVAKSNPAYTALLKGIYFILPNLEHFNIRSQVIYGVPLPAHWTSIAACYGILYAAFLLIMSSLIFSRRDL
ncbi:MAG: ABC transporter permease subunit [Chitinivibrionales bacterium]|nr:ABC transporter permease subunit [Chitinivibrionales bacterium]